MPKAQKSPTNGGALEKLDGDFVTLGIGLLMAPEMAEPIDRSLDQLHVTMQPWAANGGYFNFAERPDDLEAILPAETYARLADVKRQWDPHDMIRANHAVSMATA